MYKKKLGITMETIYEKKAKAWKDDLGGLGSSLHLRRKCTLPETYSQRPSFFGPSQGRKQSYSNHPFSGANCLFQEVYLTVRLEVLSLNVADHISPSLDRRRESPTSLALLVWHHMISL